MVKNNRKIIVVFLLCCIFLLPDVMNIIVKGESEIVTADGAPFISINIESSSVIFEGDLLSCNISGEDDKWWWIDRDRNGVRGSDESKHYTFQGDDPQIFRPEATPAGNDYVDLYVSASNALGTTTCFVTIKLYKIWFGEYHWHSYICDGDYDHNEVINNTRNDDYLDWLGGCTHDSACNDTEWDMLNAALNYSNDNPYPGSFCTFPGYEYNGGRWFKDTRSGHMNILYKHLDPGKYEGFSYDFSDSYIWYPNWDGLFYQLHQNEIGGGKWAIAIPHHTVTGQTGLKAIFISNLNRTMPFFDIFFQDSLGPTGTNFQVLFNELSYPTKYQAEQYRLDHLRGTEILQIRGENIGGLTQGFTRLYDDDMPHPIIKCEDQAWADWGVFEASQTYNKGQQRFGFFGGSDEHTFAHLGSTINSKMNSYAGGITACWAVHNVRDEIFEALNTTNTYASTPLKIRVLAEANGKRFGQWDSLTTPVTISISINASSTETEGRAYPYGAEKENADFPHNITDIWIIKNMDDDETNRIKAKVIHHKSFTGKNSNIYYEYVYNGKLNPGDYFWIAVDQEEDSIMDNDCDWGTTTQLTNKHRAWISPFFVAAVNDSEEMVANAGAPYNGIKNGTIQFQGTATGGETPYTWHWDFGDGETSTLQNPVHKYKNPGSYNVKLSVTDNESKEDTDSTTAEIEERDTKKPKVKIIRRWTQKYKDTKEAIFLPFSTVIFGDMFIMVEATDEWGIDQVEFYINNRLMHTSQFPPYSYTWVKRPFLRHLNIIKVVACDYAGNKAVDFAIVWKLP
jgi:PKD repeat protein